MAPSLVCFCLPDCVAEFSLFADSPPPPYSKRAIKERVFIEQGMKSLFLFSCNTLFCQFICHMVSPNNDLPRFHFLVYISTYANNELLKYREGTIIIVFNQHFLLCARAKLYNEKINIQEIM